jgi:glycine dehydrogenase subunit 2
MSEFRQARWLEPLIFEIGNYGKNSNNFLSPSQEIDGSDDLLSFVPEHLIRKEELDLPRLTEVEVVRHFTRLSQMNFGVDNGFYPLGSCTMKYNPKINDALASSDKVHWVHPYQPEETIQGTLEIMYNLAKWLTEITGMSKFSLQPAAGAQGEFAGVLMIRAYHKRNGELSQRNEIIIPDSAHGTNPASASMAGFKVIVVPSNADGCVNVESLKEVVSKKTAGFMLTNPNTLGIFEDRVLEIAKIIHEAGGLLYYDGANLNAILGKIKPGDMCFDVIHLNLHKTFSTPHGGGGPGSGPVGVKDLLKDFLPIPIVELDDKGRYWLNYNVPNTIGKVQTFYGNFEVLVRAYAYMLTLGGDGLEKTSEMAVLNANYLAHKILQIRGFDIPYGNEKLKHEFVLSCSMLTAETGVTAKHVGKRLLDYGVHAPTIYFPPLVKEALMIEPTETETKQELDRFVEILTEISNDAYADPKIVMDAPHNTSCGLVDEVKASHPKTMCFSWRMLKKTSLAANLGTGK